MPGHRRVRLRDQEWIPGRRCAAGRVVLSEMDDQLSVSQQRRNLWRGRAFLSQLLLPSALHSQIRQEDADLHGRDQADAKRRETVPFDDASAAASDGTGGGATGVGLIAKTVRD